MRKRYFLLRFVTAKYYHFPVVSGKVVDKIFAICYNKKYSVNYCRTSEGNKNGLKSRNKIIRKVDEFGRIVLPIELKLFLISGLKAALRFVRRAIRSY